MRTLPTSPKSFRMAPLAAALSAALSLPAAAGTYPVTSLADTLTPGTLRQAITDANAACATDANPTITFPGSGPFFINLTSALPAFSCAFNSLPYNPTIDGSSRTGYTANSSTTGWNGNALVQLDGFSTFGAPCGLQGFLYGGTMTVVGIRMTNWMYGGTAICGEGSFGSKLVVKNSLISGNGNGIRLAANSTIGGALADRNVIIANNGNGIFTTGSIGTGSIQNNLIGLGADGVTIAGNGKGIAADSTGPVTISNNYVSGNDVVGMELSGIGWTIQGNKIGVDTAGNAAGNDGDGITLRVNSGSATFVTNNVIANSTGAGVAVASGTGVRISQNSTYGNFPGIQLGVGGAVNDTDDLDTGPNLLQNSPGITSVTQSGGSTTVNYDFVSAAGTFILEFFENPTSGLSEGRTYIGAKTVTVPAGTSSSSFVVSGLYSHVSATARESTQGDTSEFWPSVAFIPTPAVAVSPTSVNFGNVPQGGSSLPRTITYTSSGSGTWNPSFFQLNSSPSCYGGPAYGGFMFSTDCSSGGTYAPGSGCSATVRFAPITLGPQTAYLCVFDNTSPNGRQSVALAGNGVVPPTLTLLPSTYDFGGVSVRTTSPPARFSMRNPGTTPVDFTASVNPPFAIESTTCRSPIGPGGACTFTLTFAPRTAGQFSEPFAVTPSVGTTAYSQLFGSGVVGPAFSVPNSIEFVYALGSEPTLHELRLVNTGTAPLTFSGITVTGTGFTLQNPCPSTLAPDEGCTLVLGFSSSTTGQTEGALTINSNTASGQSVVRLFSLSQTRPIPLIDVSPREMTYGLRSFGTMSPEQTITVRNVGGATAIVSSIVASPDYVITRNTCLANLEPLASCQADVVMVPSAYGRRSGTVTVSSNDERSPHLVNLLGTSCRTSGLILGRLGITSGCAP